MGQKITILSCGEVDSGYYIHTNKGDFITSGKFRAGKTYQRDANYIYHSFWDYGDHYWPVVEDTSEMKLVKIQEREIAQLKKERDDLNDKFECALAYGELYSK